MTALENFRKSRWGQILPAAVVILAVALFPLFRPPLDASRVRHSAGLDRHRSTRS